MGSGPFRRLCSDRDQAKAGAREGRRQGTGGGRASVQWRRDSHFIQGIQKFRVRNATRGSRSSVILLQEKSLCGSRTRLGRRVPETRLSFRTRTRRPPTWNAEEVLRPQAVSQHVAEDWTPKSFTLTPYRRLPAVTTGLVGLPRHLETYLPLNIVTYVFGLFFFLDFIGF